MEYLSKKYNKSLTTNFLNVHQDSSATSRNRNTTFFFNLTIYLRLILGLVDKTSSL